MGGAAFCRNPSCELPNEELIDKEAKQSSKLTSLDSARPVISSPSGFR